MADPTTTPEYRALYMRYLGTLSVLGDAAAHVSDAHIDGQDCRESIEMAMADAEANYPVHCRATLLRYDIEPQHD